MSGETKRCPRPTGNRRAVVALGGVALLLTFACQPLFEAEAPEGQDAPDSPPADPGKAPNEKTKGTKTQESSGRQLVGGAIEPGPALDITWSDSLLRIPHAHFARDDVSDRRLVVTEPETTWLALDDHAPRLASSASVLSRLLNEDEEISPGFHQLVAFRRDETSLFYSYQIITVETRPPGLPRAPGCTVLSPRGTYNGQEATDTVDVLVLALQAGVERVTLVVRGDGFMAEGQLPYGTVGQLKRAPDGDLEVSATCWVGDEALPAATRIVTLNSDTEPESFP